MFNNMKIGFRHLAAVYTYNDLSPTGEVMVVMDVYKDVEGGPVVTDVGLPLDEEYSSYPMITRVLVVKSIDEINRLLDFSDGSISQKDIMLLLGKHQLQLEVASMEATMKGGV